jgi:hypothetical protein
MCGRFTRMMPWPELVRLYRLTETWEKQRNDPPAYNIAPIDPVPFRHRRRERRAAAAGGPLVAGSMVGEGNAQGGDVQRPYRDGRHLGRLQGPTMC